MTELPPRDSRQRLLSALAQADASSREARADRIAWVSVHAVPFGAIWGRAESLALLEEARTCYVKGQNIATLILALSYVEHAISDALPASAGRGLAKAISEARTQGLFDLGLLGRADRLRELRNPYVHRRPDDDADTLGARITERKAHPRSIQEEDAREALEVMYGILREELARNPPSVPE